MVTGLGSNIAKCGLCTFNVIFLMVGLMAFVVGIWTFADKNQMNTLSKISSSQLIQNFNVPGLLQDSAIFLVVSGSFLMVLGFVACYGAIREIKGCLYLYVGLLLLIMITQITTCVVILMLRRKFEIDLKWKLFNLIKNSYDGKLDSSSLFTRALDWAQVYFECCGIISFKEFHNNATHWVDRETNIVPATCCILKDKNMYMERNKILLKDPFCPRTPTEINSHIHTACFELVLKWFTNRTSIIFGIAATVIILEIIDFVLACSLMLYLMSNSR